MNLTESFIKWIQMRLRDLFISGSTSRRTLFCSRLLTTLPAYMRINASRDLSSSINRLKKQPGLPSVIELCWRFHWLTIWRTWWTLLDLSLQNNLNACTSIQQKIPKEIWNQVFFLLKLLQMDHGHFKPNLFNSVKFSENKETELPKKDQTLAG